MATLVSLLSLKKSLLYGLQRALFSNCEADTASFINLSQSYHTQSCGEFLGSLPNSLIWQKIPLQKKQAAGDVLYISAIPQLLLSNEHSLPLSSYFEIPRDSSQKNSKEALKSLSRQTVNRLEKIGFNPISRELDHKNGDALPEMFDYDSLLVQLWAGFQIETHRPGWIAFRLSHEGIVRWLTHLQSPLLRQSFSQFDASDESKQPANQNNAQESSLQPLQTEKILWQAQHTYARCSQLLRLWQEMQPDLANLDLSNLKFDSDALPWLTPSSRAGLGAASAGQSLIHSLIDITDDLFWIPYQLSSQQYFLFLKGAAQLCQSFELFSSRCLSGFGQLSQVRPQPQQAALASEFQANFYLVAVTKNALKVLLSQCLNAVAPPEL